jgi:ABC-2 type transport system permease protein
MPDAVRPYLAILSARFRMLLQYRAAAAGGLVTQISFGLMLLGIYEAFYRSTDRPQPMAFAEVVSYVWLGQALLAMLPWNVDAEVRAMIRSGAVAYELCRPVDLYGLWYARSIAWRTAPTLLRAVPLCVFAAVVLPLVGLEEWRLAAPPSMAAAGAFAAALACALLLGSAISTLINISLIWTISGEGAALAMTTLTTVLSGFLLPIPLFPDWAQPIVRALPFAGVADLPFRLFTGHIAPENAVGVIGQQLVWTAVLVILGREVLRRGVRRLVVQGG